MAFSYGLTAQCPEGALYDPATGGLTQVTPVPHMIVQVPNRRTRVEELVQGLVNELSMDAHNDLWASLASSASSASSSHRGNQRQSNGRQSNGRQNAQQQRQQRTPCRTNNCRGYSANGSSVCRDCNSSGPPCSTTTCSKRVPTRHGHFPHTWS